MSQSGRRMLVVAVVPAVFLAGTTLVRGTSPSNQIRADGGGAVPRTADGRPDFQGVWTNYDSTPFERLTAAEAIARGPAVSTAEWLRQPGPISPTRPSMVIDPPNGRVPLKREAIEKRDADFATDSNTPEHFGP